MAPPWPCRRRPAPAPPVPASAAGRGRRSPRAGSPSLWPGRPATGAPRGTPPPEPCRPPRRSRLDLPAHPDPPARVRVREPPELRDGGVEGGGVDDGGTVLGRL